MVKIFQLDYIKAFLNQLKTDFSVDKKYAPIVKDLVSVLNRLEPSIKNATTLATKLDKNCILKKEELTSEYNQYIDLIKRSIKSTIDKNYQEVEKSKQLVKNKHKILNQKHNDSLLQIEDHRFLIENFYQEQLLDANMILKRELGLIEKDIIKAKNDYLSITTEIEDNKNKSLDVLKKDYDKKINQINLELDSFTNDINEKQKVLLENSEKSTANNDQIYLEIKNTFTELSIQFNKKINEIGKKTVNQTTQLNKDFQKDIDPINTSYETLDESYQNSLRETRAYYQNQAVYLQQKIEDEKVSYEEEKIKIIKESANAISLLNSKLSAFRDNLSKEKINLTRNIRHEIQTTESADQRKILSLKLNQSLKAFDQDLNKQILQNNKETKIKNREFQQKYYINEQKYLAKINDLKVKMFILDYQNKQTSIKLDADYKYKKALIDSEKTLKEAYFKYNKDVLDIKKLMTLSPLETQISIASQIQERDLNLLSNEVYRDQATLKQQQLHLNHLSLLKTLNADFLKKLAFLEYESTQKKIQTTTQLELEKEKTKRDYLLEEASLRQNQCNLLFNQTSENNKAVLQQQLIELDKDALINQINLDSEINKANIVLDAEINKRQLLIKEAETRANFLVNQKKIEYLSKMNLVELNKNQETTEFLAELLRSIFLDFRSLRNLLLKLYKIPCHPELFKSTVLKFKQFVVDIKDSLSLVAKHFVDICKDYFLAKKEDLSNYQFMIRFEDLKQIYQDHILNVKLEKKVLADEIKYLESIHLQERTELEKHLDYIKRNQGKEQKKDARIDYKETQKLLGIHELQVKKINQSLQRIDKEILEKHDSFKPLDKEILFYQKRISNEENKLELKKTKEQIFFEHYIDKNGDLYEKLNELIELIASENEAFFQSFLNEVYVTDQFINQTLKRSNKVFVEYDKNALLLQQSIINLALSFYRDSVSNHKNILDDFKVATENQIKILGKEKQKLKAQNSLITRKEMKQTSRKLSLNEATAKKKIEFSKATSDKALLMINRSLIQVEERIRNCNKKLELETLSLTDNQESIRKQFTLDLQEQTNTLNETLKKQENQAINNFNNSSKQNEQFNLSLDQKNQQLNIRYENSHKKILQAYKTKNTHYQESLLKLKNECQRLQKVNQDYLKDLENKQIYDEKNMKRHFERFKTITKKNQNAFLAKQYKDLKKSYRFKIKHLNLS